MLTISMWVSLQISPNRLNNCRLLYDVRLTCARSADAMQDAAIRLGGIFQKTYSIKKKWEWEHLLMIIWSMLCRLPAKAIIILLFPFKCLQKLKRKNQGSIIYNHIWITSQSLVALRRVYTYDKWTAFDVSKMRFFNKI